MAFLFLAEQDLTDTISDFLSHKTETGDSESETVNDLNKALNTNSKEEAVEAITQQLNRLHAVPSSVREFETPPPSPADFLIEDPLAKGKRLYEFFV